MRRHIAFREFRRECGVSRNRKPRAAALAAQDSRSVMQGSCRAIPRASQSPGPAQTQRQHRQPAGRGQLEPLVLPQLRLLTIHANPKQL